jgi:hypothetical protein
VIRDVSIFGSTSKSTISGNCEKSGSIKHWCVITTTYQVLGDWPAVLLKEPTKRYRFPVLYPLGEGYLEDVPELILAVYYFWFIFSHFILQKSSSPSPIQQS